MLNENQLLFEMARYNFTNFLVRNFDLQIEQDGELHRIVVSGFLSYDEALQYARKLHAASDLGGTLRQCRSLVISQQNLALLGTRFSYDDYDEFYRQTFQPLQISEEQLLTIPETIEQPEDEEELDEEEEEEEDDSPNGGLDFGEDFF